MNRAGVPRGTSCIAIAGTIAAAVVVLADVLHARAARRGHGVRTDLDAASQGSIVLLGFANRRPRINMINRWRARIAVRCARSWAAATIICSGGAVHGPVAEAELLRRYFRAQLGWSGQIIVEDASRSTWDNVRNVTPLLLDADWIISLRTVCTLRRLGRTSGDSGRILQRGSSRVPTIAGARWPR